MKSHELAMNLRRAYLTMHRMMNGLMSEEGITADQFVLLSVIANSDEPMTQREIVERTFSDPNTVRAMLLLLEKRGLIVRKVSHTDGRAWMVSLSASGKRAWPRIWKQSQAVRTQLSQLMSSEQADLLADLLRQLSTRLSQPANEPKSKRKQSQAVTV